MRSLLALLLAYPLAACAASGASPFTDTDGSTAGNPEGGNPDGGAPDGTTSADGSTGTPPDGSSGGDGASGGDSGTGSDTGADGGTVDGPCGGITCRGGQSCVANACVYASCTGSMVPGDYATVQNAVSALGMVGGTICLAGQSFNETVAITSAKPITITGVSAAKTTLNSFSVSGSANVTIQGIATTQQSTISASSSSTTITITNCALTGSSGAGLNVNGSAGNVVVAASKIASNAGHGVEIYNSGQLTLTFDGDDLSAASSSGSAVLLYEEDSPGNGLVFTLQNSYVHDAFVGVGFQNTCGGYGLNSKITLVNDTFMKNATGIHVAPSCYQGVAFAYYNDLVLQNMLGIFIDDSTSPTISHGNNGLFGNTTNYDGAVDGTGYVKTDPMLDTSTTPPSLGPGSPDRGAGDKTHAPTTDYWGTTRSTSPDIGAVQSP